MHFGLLDLKKTGLIKEPVPVHLAQAMCYAYIYAASHNLPEIGVQMTYCNMETEDIYPISSTITKCSIDDFWLHIDHEQENNRDIVYLVYNP